MKTVVTHDEDGNSKNGIQHKYLPFIHDILAVVLTHKHLSLLQNKILAGGN